VAGGDGESIFQPEWDPRGGLWFASDRSGYWNLYHTDGGAPRAVCPRPAEFGLPQWVFGMSTYCVLAGGDVLTAFTEQGTWRLGRLSPQTGELRVLDHAYTEYSGLRACPTGAVLLAASPSSAVALLHFDERSETLTLLRSFGETPGAASSVDGRQLSVPEPLEYPTTGGGCAHGLYYAPAHADYRGPEDERPPLLVRCHGVPTAQASTALNLRTQYWTSRGFGVLEVNYRGSTGYGRRYREALNGLWGVADVEDCIAGARFLVERGLADGRRLCISGGSAGGYTTLAALTFHDVFAAGAVYYGVSDLAALARDTHKFESRYLDRLVGPYPAARATYEERSPLLHLDRLQRPVAFFHGARDKVTPPNQATHIVDALRARGVPVSYVSFPEEGHGFRQADTIRTALEGELSFYCQIFGIEPRDPLTPLAIDNLT
jgi:dipeptidyl aminopeptidase/acylaminoacyl peptidase